MKKHKHPHFQFVFEYMNLHTYNIIIYNIFYNYNNFHNNHINYNYSIRHIISININQLKFYKY